ncbi:MAG: NADH-quinone oxidoreductase subunit J [Candidatus Eremiobacteraeota bacterium]|nr:NADH-quinone oxidoreductase subunit J [Candidatus Eremiobacteraeota bacterium]
MIAFWILAAILIVSAVWTIVAAKPVYSVVALLLNFAALAVVYLTLSAEFLAVIQIIVYSGAILVLFVFVIALLSSGVTPFATGPNRLPKIWMPAAVFVLAALVFLVVALSHAPVTTPPATAPVGNQGVFGSISDFGKTLFTVQLLPFEVTALVLMVAVIGVITLGGEQLREARPREQAATDRRMREAILREGKG